MPPGALRQRRVCHSDAGPRRPRCRSPRVRTRGALRDRHRTCFRRRSPPRVRSRGLPARVGTSLGCGRRRQRRRCRKRAGVVLRAQRRRGHGRRLRDVGCVASDRRRVRNRPARRERRSLRYSLAPRDHRHRRVAHLQEPHGDRGERARDLGDLVHDPVATRARGRRSAASHHGRASARALRRGVRAARDRRGLQDRPSTERSGRMSATLNEQLGAELDALREARTYKRFLTLESPQGPVVRMAGHGEVIVLSSNNYLGLAAHPDVVRAGIEGLERYGAGTASVRFICGTFEPHHELERALAELSGTEAALTYVSCWNANEAVIPTLTDETTVILSDELNHASIIDAIRLSRPGGKVIYPHSDMSALRDGLAAAPREARKLIVTDGVFSMEGDLAKLPEIVELARDFDAVVVVDDSHGVGVLGETGRGTVEHYGLLGEVDVITGTLGKIGGAPAGERLPQRSG